MTGASLTTEAIRTAVSDCIKQAAPIPPPSFRSPSRRRAAQKTLETDMVVVGGGGSGMSATIRGRHERHERHPR